MTEFLPKLETVINEFVENDPDHAGDEEIFDIYLAAINTDTRAALETEHLLWAHLDVRETYLDKVAYVRECLYAKRAKEDDKPKKRTLVGAVSRPPVCNTCNSRDHSWRDCDHARAKESCRACDGAQHCRFECPKRNAGPQGSQDARASGPTAPTAAAERRPAEEAQTGATAPAVSSG